MTVRRGLRRAIPAVTDLEAAWDELRAALPPGWYAGTLLHHAGRDEWAQHAMATPGAPPLAIGAAEWTAVGRSEVECVQELARCLREISGGRWPK